MRTRLLRAAVLLPAFTQCLAPLLHGQVNLETPVAFVISGAGERRPAGEDAWHPALPGVEVFAGDSLRYTQGALEFVFCGASSYRQSLVAGSVQFQRDGMPSAANLSPALAVPLCVLPLLDRTPLPSTLDDPATRLPTSGSFEEKLQTVPISLRQALLEKLTIADNMISDPALSLVGSVSRAALLDAAHLDRDALDAYRAIRDTVENASWTSQAIERITRSGLSHSGTALRARLVGDANAPGMPGAEPDFSKGQTYALVIGISKYNPLSNITPLHYAHLDAASIVEFLKTPRGGSVPDDHIWPLIDEAATRDRIDYNLVEFVKGKAGANNTLIVFIAGHGAYACKRQDLSYDRCEPGDENLEPVILVRESDPQNPKLTGFPMQRLRALLTDRAKDFGRVMLYIDVCHAGNLRDPPPGGMALPSTKATKSLQAADGTVGIMMASSVEEGAPQRQLAYEDDGLKHGVFTYFVLSGLNGAAESANGKLSFDQLYSFVSRQVTSFTKDKQAPDRFRTRSSLKVVDDTNIQPSQVLAAPVMLTGEQRSRGAGDTPDEKRFELALQRRQLIAPDPDNASDALDRLRQPPNNPRRYAELAGLLRVALEEEGQRMVLRYLEGDQTALTEADFLRGAALFRRALDLAPDASFDRSRLLFFEGRATLAHKDYARSADLLEQSIRMDPAHSYARNALGIAYLEQATRDANFLAQAVASFRDSIRLAPYWAYPRHNLALALTQTGQFAAAAAEYEGAMRLAPRLPYLPYNAGLLQQQLNRTDEARVFYKKAIAVAKGRCADRLGPTFLECQERNAPLTALATLTTGRGAALRLFREGMRDDPRSVITRHDLAVLLARKKSGKTEAEGYWKSILAAQPDYLPSLIAYSGYLQHERRFAESIPLYAPILKQHPTYAPAAIEWAIALTETGKASEAEAVLDSAAPPGKTTPAFWMAKAAVFRAQGRGDGRQEC